MTQRGSSCPNCKEVHEEDVMHAGKLCTQIGWVLQIDDCFGQHPMYKSTGVALSDTAALLHVHNAAQACCKALTLLARLWMAAAAFTPASKPSAWASFLTALQALNTSQP